MDQFNHRVTVVAAVAVALLATWELANVLLLGFVGVLLAILIRTLGEGLARVLPVPARWGSVIAVVLIVAALAGVTALLGDEVAAQFTDLRTQLPSAIASAQDALRGSELGRNAVDGIQHALDDALSMQHAMAAASTAFGALFDLIIVVLLALYLGFNPGWYVDGTVALAPLRRQDDVRTALRDSGHALRRWLLGQLVSMTVVGVLTGVGLWLVDVPNAVVLGLVAGLLEFVPIIGPIVAAVPGVLLALLVGPQTALYAALVYFVVQQLEGALIMPLAQKWAVRLPPALALFSIAVFGVLFGIPGVLVATPLAVVGMVLVRRFVMERRDDPRNHAVVEETPVR